MLCSVRFSYNVDGSLIFNVCFCVFVVVLFFLVVGVQVLGSDYLNAFFKLLSNSSDSLIYIHLQVYAWSRVKAPVSPLFHFYVHNCFP